MSGLEGDLREVGKNRSVVFLTCNLIFDLFSSSLWPLGVGRDGKKNERREPLARTVYYPREILSLAHNPLVPLVSLSLPPSLSGCFFSFLAYVSCSRLVLVALGEGQGYQRSSARHRKVGNLAYFRGTQKRVHC